MTHYNFNFIGNILSFKFKIIKHINTGNCNRVKDYLCSAYDNVNPSIREFHPCYEFIEEGITFLKGNGWKVYVGIWKGLGEQLIIVSPDGKDYYHSKFPHKG